jgi:hypothetical protein
MRPAFAAWDDNSQELPHASSLITLSTANHSSTPELPNFFSTIEDVLREPDGEIQIENLEQRHSVSG